MVSLQVSVFPLCWALGALLLNEIAVNAQQFVTPATDTNHYGNLSESVDFVWTYTTPDLSKTSITCIVNLVNIVFKRASAGATAAIQPGYNGRATAIDDTTSSPYRIGFKLNNLVFSDASDYYCSMSYESGAPIRSKVYIFQICERPRAVNCLTDGVMVDNNGVNYFSLREGGVLNSTCYVYGNPVPTLNCRTYDNANIQQVALPEVIRNYTSYPVTERMRFFNVRRAVTKVICIADGKHAGKVIVERVVRVDYLPSAPRDIKLIKSTPHSIRISWIPPLEPGISRISDYYMELFHPNGTITKTNYTVLSANPVLDYTFTRLFANQEYRIRVSAYNAIGRGAQSPEAIFTTFISMPSAPLNIQLVHSMPESIRITWTAPRQSGSSRITKYLMELFHPNGTNTMSNYTIMPSDPILEYNFTNLLPKTTYGIQISAYNSYGKGPRSVLVEYKTAHHRSVPAKIDQFTLTPRTVNETGNVSIECIVSGNPLPNITITGHNYVTVQHSMGKATLNNVHRNQAGLYICKASNGVSSPVSAAIKLVVNYIPEISFLYAVPSQSYTGSYSRIVCYAIGKPRPRYRYYHEDGTLLLDTVTIIYTVTLRNEDYPRYRAKFMCVPYNILGEGTAQNVTVEILVPPRLSVSMLPETVDETDNAVFSCAVLAANPSANITMRGISNQTLVHWLGITILSNLTRDDAGTYSCIADNGLRGSPVIETTKLAVNHAPDQVQFTTSPPKPISGSSFTLNCMARGSPSPSFRFILVNGSSTKIIQNGPSTSCTIFKLDYKEYINYTVTYRCISYNTFGDSSPHDQTLNIQVLPVLSFSITPNIVNETQNATADCKVLAANPTPSIIIRGNSNQIIPHIGGQAKLKLITRAQAGEYSCIADNGVVGAITSTATLTVKYAPDRVDLLSSSMTPLNGSSVALNCSCSGSPLPYRFVFSRINGTTQTAVQDSASSIYLIQMINFKNFISYKAMFACVPYNTVGRGLSKNITLDIQVRPEIRVPSTATATEGQNVDFHCTVTAANPLATVIWLGPTSKVLSLSPLLTLNSVNRNQGGEYSCIASNGISPNARKTTFLSVNYVPRFMENSKVYEKCIGENASLLCNAVGSPIPDISLYLHGLLLASNVSGLRYHVAIDSTGRAGAYICSSKNSVGTVNITTTIKVKRPGSVTNINLNVNENTIRVTWDPLQCIGNIKEMKVQYRKKGESDWGMRSSTVTATDKEFIINGLDNGVEYEVRIVVVDISGKEHMTQASGTAKLGTSTDTSISASTIALYTLIPVFMIIIAALLLWIMRLKNTASSIPMTSSNANQNMRKHYVDLELTTINRESQPHATIANSGALAYEQSPESKSN